MNLMQSPLVAIGFERVFQTSASVIGSENNAIASIASARNVDFTTAREMYEAEQYAREQSPPDDQVTNYALRRGE